MYGLLLSLGSLATDFTGADCINNKSHTWLKLIVSIKAYLKGHESWDLASSVISTLIGATSNYTCSYIICNPAHLLSPMIL